ncbi:CIC11C00000002552 [Sungouiella intermedia]|uniref:CIC11C00000002552 n=1 Tax=Sungouiella intermedia TaxID=45354 RepID=A0A1L0DA82_9ASCO|nr:CIC11C00000002552 [[Candida] intermedia]
MVQDYESLDGTKRLPRSYARIWWKVIGLILILAIGLHVWNTPDSINQVEAKTHCAVPEYVILDSYRKDNSTLVKIIYDEAFRNTSAAKLTGAVRVRTDVGDDAPTVDEDPEYWEKRFGKFHTFLEKTFPGVWNFCKIEKVNHYSLVITWEGSESSLKPVMLTAHQDVVPIQEASLDQWEYPPFDGFYNGDQLWGRGSADCKNLLIALLETAEELYNSGFRPRRSIIYAFGFDEEIGGLRGANHISEFLLQRYGENGLYAVVDEGGQSLVKHGNVALALIGTGEKGMLNVKVEVDTPGGHSSVPPDHTSIGIISELVTRLEKNPFAPVFSDRNPTFYEYQCIAEHSDAVSPEIRRLIKESQTSKAASKKVADYIYNSDLGSRYLVTTSQAVDIVHGGVKSNALPEHVELVINHRIAVESSVDEVMKRNTHYIQAVAENFDLGLQIGGETISAPTAKGHITVSTSWNLEPSPFTPIYDGHWETFAGTLRHVYEVVCRGTLKEFEGLRIIATPGMAAGNTDTQYYWGLTKHIYRYRPGLVPLVQAHAHGANENIPFDSHLQIIAFYYEYLQVVGEVE